MSNIAGTDIFDGNGGRPGPNRSATVSGLGAAFLVEPAEGKLPPWGVVEVSITVFNDTPGRYSDKLELGFAGMYRCIGDAYYVAGERGILLALFAFFGKSLDGERRWRQARTWMFRELLVSRISRYFLGKRMFFQRNDSSIGRITPSPWYSTRSSERNYAVQNVLGSPSRHSPQFRIKSVVPTPIAAHANSGPVDRQI